MSSAHTFYCYTGIRWVRIRSNCCNSSRRNHPCNRKCHRKPFVWECNRRSCKLPDSVNRLLVAGKWHSRLYELSERNELKYEFTQ